MASQARTGKLLQNADSARLLSTFVRRRPVIDRTALTADYDIELTWMPDARPSARLDAPADPNAPSLFTALQEQLGLEFQASTGPFRWSSLTRAA